MSTELSWGYIIQFFQKNKKINKRWIKKNMMPLGDQFFIIGLLNDYIDVKLEENIFWTNFDLYEYEIYKRLLVLGYFLDIVPTIADCSVNNYEILEREGIIDLIINELENPQEYNNCLNSINQYNNINIKYCLYNIKDFVNNIFNQNKISGDLNEFQDFLNANEELINNLNECINFNKPSLNNK